MIRYLKMHQSAVKRLFSFAIMIILAVFFIIELKHFDFQRYLLIIERYNVLHFLALAVVGYVSFLPSLGYDYLLAEAYQIPIKKKDILLNALISQGFNNFITFGGSVGMKFRVDLYRRHHIESIKVIQISLFVALASLLGLASYILPAVLYLGPIITPALRIMAIFSLFLPLFFFSELTTRFPRVNSFLLRRNYTPLKLTVKVKLWGNALLDWAASSSFFVLICHLLVPSLPLLPVYAIYIVGQLTGVLSFVPGGVGSFDLTILLLLKKEGMPATEALLAIFLFRLLYNLGPVFVSAIVYLYQFIRGHVSDGKLASQLIANVMLMAGLINIFSVATPTLEERYQILAKLLPPGVTLTAQYLTLLSGFILLVMSQGIRRRLKRAYRLTLLLLPLSALFCLIKGLDYEQAFLLLVFSFILYSVRQIFALPDLPLAQAASLYAVGTTFLGVGGFMAVYNTSHHVNFLKGNQAFSLAWLKANRLILVVIMLGFSFIVAPILHKRKK